MIRFYENRNIFFAISIIIIIAGIIGLFVNGLNLDIEFKGGAILKYSLTGDIDANGAGDVAAKALNKDVDAQITTEIGTDTKKLVLSLSEKESLTAQEQEALEAALFQAYPDNELKFSESNVVQPFIGKRFLQRSLFALLLAFILIIIYVGYRFQRISGISAGVMALIALLHDVMVVFFTYVLFKIPLDESFIAISLTIIGFSVNDTIVIYDRIRENVHLYKKMSVVELVNKSITQSVTRSTNTSLACIISMIVIYIYAVVNNIESIQTFAFPMTIGLMSGVYSTICLAGPLWAMWQNHKEAIKE